MKQYGFLPQPLMITVEGDEVVLQFPKESTADEAEAARLAQKDGKKAAEGDFAKATELLKRALKLQPSLHSARRDLAMACMEMGDAESATNHLIEVLRLDPSDAWSWVVLGNLYLGPKNDPETGEKFLRKALSLKPGDAWALNSLAALCHKRGESTEAVRLFEQAIAANPQFANPYLGAATAHAAMQQPDQAAAVLQRLFHMGRLIDTRTHSVYAQARQLYARVQADLARRDESEMFKCVQNYKAGLEALSGYPIKIEEGDLTGTIGARIQMAWAHGRDHHLITTRRGSAPELLCHRETHELTHLKIEAEARQAGKNQFFITNERTHAAAHMALRADADKLRRSGSTPADIQRLHRSLIQGLCGFLFNCPLDMLIERHLHQTFPVLRSAQFLSLHLMADDALKANTNPEIIKLTPRKILRATLAMNGAYSLFLDDLFEGATTFAAPYRQMDNFDMAKRLYQHWNGRSQDVTGGGREYSLVDEFADLLGIRDWYEWQPDPGHHEVAAEPFLEGVTDEKLLRLKHPAAVCHLLSALERYDKLPIEQVREITFEVARVGQNGIDYASADKQYTLRSLPGETFTGLQLMCLMHAGLKRLAPDTDTGMDLDEPFLKALELHQQREGKR
jgi:Tfp pilus assembly protein PilF